MKAFILVDVQNDFFPRGALPVPGAEAIIPVVSRVQECFELVIATQDWHPPHHGSFASSHSGQKPFDTIELYGLNQILWPNHCVQGSAGADFHKEINMNKAEAIFRKGTDPEVDSYSAFYDNGRRKSTGLAGYLREKNVDEIYLGGLAGDICVFFTAMDSLDEKFTTVIIEDAIKPLSQDEFEKNMQRFMARGGKVMPSTKIK